MASAQETVPIDRTVDFEAGLLRAQARLLHLASIYKYMHECKDGHRHEAVPKSVSSNAIKAVPGKTQAVPNKKQLVRDTLDFVPDKDLAEDTFKHAQALVQDLIRQAHADKRGLMEARLQVIGAQLIVCRARGTFEWAFGNSHVLRQTKALLGEVKGCLEMCSAGREADKEDTILLQVQCAEALLYAIQYELGNATTAVDGHASTQELFQLANKALESAETKLCKRKPASNGNGQADGLLWLAYQVRVDLLSCHAANIRSDRRLNEEYNALLATAKSLADMIKPEVERAPANVMIHKAGMQATYECTCAAERQVLLYALGKKSGLELGGTGGSQWWVHVVFCRGYSINLSVAIGVFAWT